MKISEESRQYERDLLKLAVGDSDCDLRDGIDDLIDACYVRRVQANRVVVDQDSSEHQVEYALGRIQELEYIQDALRSLLEHFPGSNNIYLEQ